MRLPARVRVRTMMAAIALVAFGFGVTFEVRNHARRDRLLRGLYDRHRRAAVHHWRALECRHAEIRRLPYRRTERLKLLSGDWTWRTLPGGGFPSWEAERQHHDYWGTSYREETVEGKAGRELQALEAKLLLP